MGPDVVDCKREKGWLVDLLVLRMGWWLVGDSFMRDRRKKEKEKGEAGLCVKSAGVV